MQFIVLGYDGTDEGAPSRRLAARPAHLKRGEEAVSQGHQVLGAAILDDDGRMRGSLLVMNFPSRALLDSWLEKEPYVQEGVWQQVEVHACAISPHFAHLLAK